MGKSFKIKEAFLTLQGEGAQTGKPAVFCRFTGCNLWNGREMDRERAACNFCDTDFVGTDGQNGGLFETAEALVNHLERLWRAANTSMDHAMIVFTGGEPALQLTDSLIELCKNRGFLTAVETNGTLPLPQGLDWVCVSPKGNTAIKVRKGNELKLVFPQKKIGPESLSHLQFEHFYLQPLDGPEYANNLSATVKYCLRNPQWRLSLQTHKLIGID